MITSRTPESRDQKTAGRRIHRLTHIVTNTPRATTRRVFVLSTLVALLLATAAGVSAHDPGHGRQCNRAPNSGDAQIVEWDIPAVDLTSGAITVDVHASHSGRLWFLSRVGDVKLYRLDPGNPIRTKAANWKSFLLDPTSLTTGGLKRIKVHKNDQDVFVRTLSSLQRINTSKCKTVMMTETCERTTWFDQVRSPMPRRTCPTSRSTTATSTRRLRFSRLMEQP